MAWLFLFVPLAALAAEAPVPPSPDRWATDNVGFLSAGMRARLDARLEAFEHSTGEQVLLWIGDSTGDTSVEDWAVKTFAAWKVGRKGLDDGLVVFVFKKDKRIRIEVGYGLEDKVPDAVASRVIREVIAPRLQAGDPDGSLDAGIGALLGAIRPEIATKGGPAPSAGGRAPVAPRASPLQLVFMGLLGVGFVILLVTHPSMALYLLFSILSGGRGGGSSGGGGGFSGGGGRSGGGGATGGW
jgi:uncharacterized protein